jgi:uncharacterized protein with PQ loop repeat
LTTILAAVAASWGCVMAVSPVLQIKKMRAHRSSKEVSIGYLVVLLIGFFLWLAYGIGLGNVAIIVPNVVSVVVAAVTILVARHYRQASTDGR